MSTPLRLSGRQLKNLTIRLTVLIAIPIWVYCSNFVGLPEHQLLIGLIAVVLLVALDAYIYKKLAVHERLQELAINFRLTPYPVQQFTTHLSPDSLETWALHPLEPIFGDHPRTPRSFCIEACINNTRHTCLIILAQPEHCTTIKQLRSWTTRNRGRTLLFFKSSADIAPRELVNIYARLHKTSLNYFLP